MRAARLKIVGLKIDGPAPFRKYEKQACVCSNALFHQHRRDLSPLGPGYRSDLPPAPKPTCQRRRANEGHTRADLVHSCSFHCRSATCSRCIAGPRQAARPQKDHCRTHHRSSQLASGLSSASPANLRRATAAARSMAAFLLGSSLCIVFVRPLNLSSPSRCWFARMLKVDGRTPHIVRPRCDVDWVRSSVLPVEGIQELRARRVGACALALLVLGAEASRLATETSRLATAGFVGPHEAGCQQHRQGITPCVGQEFASLPSLYTEVFWWFRKRSVMRSLVMQTLSWWRVLHAWERPSVSDAGAVSSPPHLTLGPLDVGDPSQLCELGPTFGELCSPCEL